jgi:lipopolysaccharide transport system permease protein
VWYRFLNPIRPFHDLYAHRELLRQIVRREIEARYRGSYLGVLWAIVTPLLMLAIYTFVFSTIFQGRWRPEASQSPPQPGDFALPLFAGLIAFNVFAECIARAPTLVLSNTNYVKNVVFPVQILPVSAVGAALFHAAINVAILIVASIALSGMPSTTIWLLPVAALPLLALCLGLSWFLASLGVFLRDIAYATSLVTQALFFLTPIFYPRTALPEHLQTALAVNPLSHIVEDFRRTLLWSQVPEWTTWAIAMGACGGIFVLGYAWFMITRTGFADVV